MRKILILVVALFASCAPAWRQVLHVVLDCGAPESFN